MTMQKIMIKDLGAKCVIGVNPDERNRLQEVIINITVWADLSKAMRSDSIADTVDYGALAKKVVAFVEKSNFKLLEKLTGGVALECFEDERVAKVKVRIEKPEALKRAKSASVEITLAR